MPTYSSYDAGNKHSHLQSNVPLPTSPLPPTASETDALLSSPPPNVAEGNYGDSSDKIFSVYLSQADKFDKEQSESWKGDTEGILVFVRPSASFLHLRLISMNVYQTGLFSATVAAFIIESYKQLQPSSSDTTVLLLAQISRQLTALSTGTPIVVPSGLPSQSFRPPASAIRVNTFWFISLVLSLTCALLATLMQQWVRRYIQVTQRWYAPYKRARIRTFFAEGVEQFGLPRAVEALPALLHAAVFLFFAGLVDFMININHSVAFPLLSAVAVAASAYLLSTVHPLLYPNSPYQTPLTSFLWVSQQAVLVASLNMTRRVARFIYGCTNLVSWKLYGRLIFLLDDHSRRLAQGFLRSRETTALRQPTEMDARALAWTLDTLDEDHELEQLVAAIPGYYRSTMVQSPHTALKHIMHHEGLDEPLEARILDLHSPRGTVPQMPPASAVERKRRVQSLEALYCLPGVVARHLRAAVIEPALFTSDPLFTSSEAWAVAVNMAKDTNKDIAFAGHCVTAVLVMAWRFNLSVTPGPGDDVGLLARHLGVPKDMVQAWTQQGGGDSLMLANLIRLLKNTVDDLHEQDAIDLLPITTVVMNPSSRHNLLHATLGLVNKFRAAGAAPELQAEFTTVWARVETLEHGMRESGYRAYGLEMVLRRMSPVLFPDPNSGGWMRAM